MNIQFQRFIINTMASSIDDPLIDWQAESVLKVLVFIVILATAIAIRFISSQMEYAIIFALVCTLISVAFFVIK